MYPVKLNASSLPVEPEYDVVVVGARAAGAATAMLLAQRGARVLVVDRSSEGSDTLSTHALMRAGVLQLRRWGLLDRLIAAGTPAIRHTAFHYGNVITNVTLKPVAGVEALYAPRRTVLDPLLVDAARQAGAEVRFGASMTDLLRDPHGRVTGVVVTGPDGSRVPVRATVTVGADGLRSRTARRLRLCRGARAARVQLVLPEGRQHRCDPHQRRRGVRLRGHHPRSLPP
jgi:2-polyprenyl-6-methoxyphenol hydroxylase-like FAD-dependent oxidoreductase